MADPFGRLDPRRLLTLRAVAQHGSFSGAARALGWTQSAVSQSVAALERSAKTQLVVRTPTGAHLTPSGEQLVHHAVSIAQHLEAASQDLAQSQGQLTGTVRLAAFPSALGTLVPAALHLLHEQWPGLRVELLSSEPPEAEELIRSGRADLAVVFAHDDDPQGPYPGLESIGLGRDPLRVVIPVDRPCPAALGDLATDEWIAGCTRCRTKLHRVCHEAGFTPRIVHDTEDSLVVQALVAQDLGVAMLPELTLRGYQHPGVRACQIEGIGHRHISLLRWTTYGVVPAVHAAAECITAAATDLLTHQPAGT